MAEQALSTTQSPWRATYVFLVGVAGLVLPILGLVAVLQMADYRLSVTFFLLVALAIISQIFVTSTDVTFEISPAIGLAAVPFFGPAAAALIVASAQIGLWVFNRRKPNWRGSWEQLVFNVGMFSFSIFVAGWVFLGLQSGLQAYPVLSQLLPWFAAAVVANQINVWLLIGILYLQRRLNPLKFWVENRWAMVIDIALMSIGGSLLAIAVGLFEVLGIIAYFLPIFLSAYAFRLYVSRTTKQMEEMESIIARRTQELVKANHDLAELNRQKDAFLAVLTHDMRSPLTSINGYATLLRDFPELDAPQRQQMADIILRNETILLDIVDNILEIEQLQSGAPIVLEHEFFDLRDVMQEVIDLTQANAQEKQIRLYYDPCVEPIYVNADRPKIHRIVQNLVSNAVKYTPEKGKVLLNAQKNGQHMLIQVMDNGYGIPAGELPYIFDRFRRVDKHKGKAMGTGLGLAVVKSLVEAHGGEVSVASEEGVGSEFTVKIPA